MARMHRLTIRFRLSALGTACAFSTLGGTARAAPTRPAPGETTAADAEQLAEQARAAFKAGNFERAAKLYMQAYARTPKPALVYNAARCYEDAKMRGEAVGLFRLYISLSQDADGIVEAQDRLARLDGKIVKPLKPEVAPRPAVVTATALPDVPTPTASVPWQTWALAGGSAAALAGGVTLLLAGRARVHDANVQGVTLGVESYNNAYDKANSQWWTGAGLTAMGAGLGVAAYWWRAQPVVAPTGRGIVATIRF